MDMLSLCIEVVWGKLTDGFLVVVCAGLADAFGEPLYVQVLD